MEKQRIPDNDRDIDSRCEGDDGMDPYHERDRHNDHDKRPYKGGHLFGDESFDGLHIRSTALNDVAGTVGCMPFVGQGEQMSEELVPHPFDQPLGASRIEGPEQIAAQGSHEAKKKGGSCDQQEISFQKTEASRKGYEIFYKGRKTARIFFAALLLTGSVGLKVTGG